MIITRNDPFRQVVQHRVSREMHEIIAIEKRNHLDTRREQTRFGRNCRLRALVELAIFEQAAWLRCHRVCAIQFQYLGMNCFKYLVGVCTLLQQDNAFHCVGIVNNDAVFAANRLADLPQPNPCALHHVRDVADTQGRAFLRLNHRIRNVVYIGEQADDRADVDRLLPFFDEAATRVHIVSGQLLLNLRYGQAIGGQFVRIKLYLVLSR